MLQTPRFLTKTDGMSILEVVIAAGLAAIVSLALASMIQSMSKEQSYLQQKMDIMASQALITQVILSDPVNCSVSVLGVSYPATTPSSVSLDQLFLGPTTTSNAIVKTASSTAPGGLLVTSIAINGITNFVGTTYQGQLEIDFINSVRAVKKMSVPFKFYVNPTTNLIVGCGDTSSGGSFMNPVPIAAPVPTVWTTINLAPYITGPTPKAAIVSFQTMGFQNNSDVHVYTNLTAPSDTNEIQIIFFQGHGNNTGAADTQQILVPVVNGKLFLKAVNNNNSVKATLMGFL